MHRHGPTAEAVAALTGLFTASSPRLAAATPEQLAAGLSALNDDAVWPRLIAALAPGNGFTDPLQVGHARHPLCMTGAHLAALVSSAPAETPVRALLAAAWHAWDHGDRALATTALNRVLLAAPADEDALRLRGVMGGAQ